MSIIQDIPAANPSLEKLLSHTHHKTYPAKKIIIHEGDNSESLYYIIEGSVSVQAESESGDEIILAHLSAGDFFGESGLFDLSDEDARRSAWVHTRSDCIVAEISYQRFRKIVTEDPTVMFLLTGQLFTRLRKTSMKVRDLIFLDVKGRIARCLLELSSEPDAMTHPDGMQIKSTRQDLAKMVGCSREMAGRVLKELEDDELISAHGKTIVVFGTRKPTFTSGK
ncbi:MAG: cAMP-activated global transcriptional regulator CRP [Gammaproteobacteria bacterium]|nr:cAMP-activated global transcriptional regulator CRP [Gammaproteobacteria bacterium]